MDCPSQEVRVNTTEIRCKPNGHMGDHLALIVALNLRL